VEPINGKAIPLSPPPWTLGPHYTQMIFLKTACRPQVQIESALTTFAISRASASSFFYMRPPPHLVTPPRPFHFFLPPQHTMRGPCFLFTTPVYGAGNFVLIVVFLMMFPFLIFGRASSFIPSRVFFPVFFHTHRSRVTTFPFPLRAAITCEFVKLLKHPRAQPFTHILAFMLYQGANLSELNPSSTMVLFRCLTIGPYARLFAFPATCFSRSY